MPKLRVQSFAISLDGYGAGPNQDLQNPLGVAGPELMEWFFQTRVWRKMHGLDDGETGIDNGIAEQGMSGIGAWILGRNMFGPVRGPWPDENWKGWWGDEPPYHTPVFVLTHHARPPRLRGRGLCMCFCASVHERSCFSAWWWRSIAPAATRKLQTHKSPHNIFLRQRWRFPFSQYSDDIASGFADEGLSAAFSHDVCKLLSRFVGVVTSICPEISFVGDSNRAAREMRERFVRNHCAGWKLIHLRAVGGVNSGRAKRQVLERADRLDGHQRG